ncbi:hypothetical protein EIP86_003518 [Pleurotus ostreatoroseus]|nr:hypothetical protein EIP86_003518 [Pleurotus ostreatoroseus]
MSDQFQFLYPPQQQQQQQPIVATSFQDPFDYAKQQQGFDFADLSSCGADSFANYPSNNPHLDLDLDQFDNEIDSSLAQFDVDIHHLPFDLPDPFTLLRNDTPTRGVPSTFTVSSESVSAYEPFESLSAYSESHYNYPRSENAALSEIDQEMKRFGLSPADELSFSLSSPSSATNSPPMGVHAYSPTAYSSRGSFSEYEGSSPVRIHLPSSSASDYYPQVNVAKYPQMAQATVSPANVSVQLPNGQSMQPAVVPSQRSAKSESGITSAMNKDPKRKYQCPTCPRAFARAYNLKTHIQTHDPNRLKPYACHHKSCGRSFSRKHDLTRHLISIHRSDNEDLVGSPQAVGVASGNRKWCDQCGQSWVSNGKITGCKCDDVK